MKKETKHPNLLTTSQQLYNDKELNNLRWAINVILFGLCSAYKSHGRGICRNPLNWKTKGNTNGRCKFHSGSDTVHGPKTTEGRRNQIMSRISNLKKTDLVEVKKTFSQEDERLYIEVSDYLKDNFEVDAISCDQIATVYVLQKNYLIPKLQEGYNIDLVQSSEMIRRWMNEYKLTPKSKGFDIDTSALPVGWWAEMVKNYETKNKEQEQEKKTV